MDTLGVEFASLFVVAWDFFVPRAGERGGAPRALGADRWQLRDRWLVRRHGEQRVE